MQQAKAALQHGDIVDQVQHGRSGLGFGKGQPYWSKATPVEQRKMVVAEVCRQEEESRHAKAVTQAKQGQWTRWERQEKQKISRKDMCVTEANRISFLIQATYAVLLQKTSTNGWVKIHHAPSASYTLPHPHWVQDEPLSRTIQLETQQSPEVSCINSAKQENNHQCLATQTDQVKHTCCICLRGRTKAQQLPPEDQVRRDGGGSGLADVCRHWPATDSTIADSCHQPEVLWSSTQCRVYFVELTVPWEDAVQEAFERERSRYSELAADSEGGMLRSTQ